MFFPAPLRGAGGTCSSRLSSGAGVEFVMEKGVEAIRRHEEALTIRLLDGLSAIAGLTTYGAPEWERRVGVVSFNLDGLASSEVASRLDEAYGICVRSGLHCSPLAHRTIGTLATGTVRASFSFLNAAEHVDCLLQALTEISRS